MRYLWFFEPDALISLPFIAAVLFALGGSGHKSLRRILLPAVILASSLSMGKNGVLAVVASLLLSLSLFKGYGDSLKEQIGSLYYPALFAVGASYGLALMPLANAALDVLLVLIPCVTFGSLTYTSQKHDFPVWKWVELLTGFSIGLTAYLLIK